MTDHTIDMLQTAAWYASGGWKVFPVAPLGKDPLTKNGYKDASSDKGAIAGWWQAHPDANIGLACGPSRLIALDGDPAKYTDESRAFLDSLLETWPTTTQGTPTGGHHFIYGAPAGEDLDNSAGGLPPGFDVRFNGYVLLAPSEVVYHGEKATAKGVPDGHRARYSWLPGRGPHELLPQPLPAEVLALLKAKPAAKTTTKTTAAPSGNGAGYTMDDTAKATDALRRLAPWRREDYSENGAWLQVGMALQELGPLGLKLWDDWSKGSPKYEPGTCRAKWNSFKRNGLTLGSLIHWAKQDDPTGHGFVRQVNRDAAKAAAPDATDSTDDTSPKGEKKGKGGEDEEAEKRPQADILYEMALEHAEIFTAQDGTPYAFVPIEGRRECYRLKDANFAGWLTALYRGNAGKIPGADSRTQAIAALAWDARKTRRDVFIRVGAHGGKVYIDLGTEEWDAIEVDEDGWRIVDTPPVAFRRPASMRPLPLPQRGGTLADLRKHLNLEPEQWALVAAWLVAAAHPRGPYPVLAFTGEHGSAKSTNVRVVKELIDPAAAGLRGQPEDIRDLWIGANNSWVLAFDNVSHLNNDVSDALCRLATGGGYAKRANYTDDGEFVMDAQRPVVINGIGDVVTRADLMDRAILINPPVIPEDKRLSEKDFWRAFEQDRPRLLGALLNALSMALGRIGSVELETLPRMADFALLAVAAEPAYKEDLGFLDAYHENREEAHATVVETSTLGEHLRALVLVDGAWEGTPSELLAALDARASDNEKRSRAWPKVANRIKPALQRLAPSLRHVGVGVEFPPRQKDGRRIRLVRLNE